MILLPFKINGNVKASGLYTELNSYSIPLFVASLSFDYIFNPNASVLVFHITPNALSFCTSSLSSPLMLMFFLQYSSGIDIITSILLLTNFVKMNPPALQIFLILWITLLLHQFLLKTSACHQQECSYCIKLKIYFIICRSSFQSIIAPTWR